MNCGRFSEAPLFGKSAGCAGRRRGFGRTYVQSREEPLFGVPQVREDDIEDSAQQRRRRRRRPLNVSRLSGSRRVPSGDGCTTTDNGSNFVKAFRVFERAENDDEDSDAIEFYNLYNLLILADIEDTNAADLIILPPHHRCVSHTLNLIAVKDTEKPLGNDALYKKKYRIIFAKLSKLWSKQNQSTQVADKIKEYCGVYLKTPVITRWNSTFDSVLQLVVLLKNDTEKINKCWDYCDLQRLTDHEIKFLEEYCQVNCSIEFNKTYTQ
ncbi:uncharacterized protein [Linepithema humile]|uniref:uncharacterized protein n=1 Tax=Linepithema humile TaxID=83485 RepID=UPI00351EBA7F